MTKLTYRKRKNEPRSFPTYDVIHEGKVIGQAVRRAHGNTWDAYRPRDINPGATYQTRREVGTYLLRSHTITKANIGNCYGS